MGEASKTKTCAYCGAAADTVDHIPPKLFLSRPYPENLLTVPACSKCNKSFQADDEYTRLITSIDFRADRNAAVREKRPSVLRSLQRPEAVGFATYLLKQMQPSTILGWDGNPFAQRIDVDTGRVNASGERIVRGLYFYETGGVVDRTLRVRVASKAGVTSSDPAIKPLCSHISVLA